MEKSFIVVDTETMHMAEEVEGKWNNVYGFGLASCVIYDSTIDRFLFFGPGDKGRDQACRYLTTSNLLVVGFNSIDFDSKLLLGNDRKLDKNVVSGERNGEKFQWKEYDIIIKSN